MDRHKWWSRAGRVLDKGLLIEDAPDGDCGLALGIALQVGLVPAKAETGEGAWIQWRMLDQEHIEARVRGEATGSQDHEIVLPTRDKPIGDVDTRLRVLDGRAGEGLPGLQARVHPQWELAGRSLTSILGILWGGGGLGMAGGDPDTDQGRQGGHDKGGHQDCWQQATTEAETMPHWKAPLSMERKSITGPERETRQALSERERQLKEPNQCHSLMPTRRRQGKRFRLGENHQKPGTRETCSELQKCSDISSTHSV
jgi:hypothetical protein